jgi:hypothetical protein
MANNENDVISRNTIQPVPFSCFSPPSLSSRSKFIISSKKELLLFKIDFEKAFDSVDWDYLNVFMTKMNFSALWRKWIMECVTTTSAFVLVNGCPTYEFHFERGIRQGDPL